MANGAIYSDDGTVLPIHDRKLDALEDIIESANGKPVLVAYWFRHDLLRIRQRFTVREIKTSQDIADWNAGAIPVAVIHPASAGHGLNLQQGGSTLVWFGLTWSLELYQQTNARLWRQGQTAGTVVIQHIITKGTIDGRILKALKEKNKTQAALIDAVRASLRGGQPMSVIWKYLNKRSGAIDAIRDYDSMKFIIENTSEDIKQAYASHDQPALVRLRWDAALQQPACRRRSYHLRPGRH
jgi:SNF2 family DNA or RNA helicase